MQTPVTPESPSNEEETALGAKTGLTRALDLTVPEWEQIFETFGEPSYRAKQVFLWLHHRHAAAYRVMSDFSEELRQKLEEQVPLQPLELVEQRTDPDDGASKSAWRLEDGELIETVKMPSEGKEGEEPGSRGATICLSTQVGCGLACRFCATGKMGERRNLSPGEIVQQVYRLWEGDVPVKRLVLMGMGEPLRNYDNVLRAIELLKSEDGLNLSPRRITLSTVGLVPEIYRLAQDRPGIRLAVSLHGTTDVKRRALVPVTRGYTLDRLMDAVRVYQKADGQRVSFEYVLLHGHNDSSRDVERLVELLRGIPAHVNLIPFNPVEGSPFEPPPREAVRSFLGRMRDAGIEATVRRSRGPRINAACGQLRAELSA